MKKWAVYIVFTNIYRYSMLLLSGIYYRIMTSSFLGNYLGDIVVGVLVVALGGIVIHHYKDTKEDYKDTKKLLNKLVFSFNLFVNDSISGKLKENKEYLVSYSPTVLTEKGEKVARESGMVAYIESKLERYRKEVGDFEKVVDPLEVCRNISLDEFESGVSQVVDIERYFVKKGISKLIMREIYSQKLTSLLFGAANNE